MSAVTLSVEYDVTPGMPTRVYFLAEHESRTRPIVVRSDTSFELALAQLEQEIFEDAEKDY